MKFKLRDQGTEKYNKFVIIDARKRIIAYSVFILFFFFISLVFINLLNAFAVANVTKLGIKGPCRFCSRDKYNTICRSLKKWDEDGRKWPSLGALIPD